MSFVYSYEVKNITTEETTDNSFFVATTGVYTVLLFHTKENKVCKKFLLILIKQ